MPPRTRRSQRSGSKDHTQGVSDENCFYSQSISTSEQGNAIRPSPNATPPNARDQAPNRAKRTLSATDFSIPLSPANPMNAAKRARKSGPAHGHPMPLELNRENELVDQQEGGLGKGKEKSTLRRTSSYYPGRGDNTHVLAQPDPDPDHPETDTEENVIETEEDWIGDDLTAKGPASKISEAIAAERPVWKEASTSSLSSSGGATAHISVDTTQDSDVMAPASALLLLSQMGSTSSNSSATTMLPTETPGQIWPADTDILFPTGSNKLMLTLQRPLIRAIIQEACEHIRAYLMFTNAFPDFNVGFTFARDSLMAGAEAHRPAADIIRQRFQHDDKYFNRLLSLPRARICYFRSEVKDRCNAITMAALHAFGNAADIARNVRFQLSDYNYTFPYGELGDNPHVTPKRTLPYRNARIVTVIRDLYFTGASGAFGRRFEGWFPLHECSDGVTRREVPVPMVALIATALYATLYEWRTGAQQLAEFSTNTYLDVYLGHVNTLNHIGDKREVAYHIMMGDLYSRASASLEIGDAAADGATMADLDLQELEA